MAARLVVALLLLSAVAGGLVWVVSSAPDAGDDIEQHGDHRVAVVGPDGDFLGDRTVHTMGTPLAALQQLALWENFTVDVEEQPWIGSGCTAQYVIGIAGIRESTTGGWNYYVRASGEEWMWKPAGAACYHLQAGDQVEWCWVESDVCRHHAP